MSLVDIKKYKLAKKYKADSTDLLKVIDLSIRGLTPFMHYKEVRKSISQLKDSQGILKAHLRNAERLLNEK